MSKANKSSVPELRFPEFKNAPAWRKKKLGDVSKISTGSSNRRDSTSNSGKYTFFDRSQDIRTSNIFLFDSEAIIVAGEGQNFIPKYFIGKFDLHQRTYAIMDFKKSLSKFIFYFIYQNKEYFLSQAVGSTVKSLRLPMFEKMVINLPKPKEQQKIADCLTSLDDLITAQSQKVDSLKQHKKGLMQQLFPQADTNLPKLRFPDFKNSPAWEESVFKKEVEIIDGDRGKNYPKSEDFSSNGYCLFLNAKNVTKYDFSFNQLKFISKEKDHALRNGKLKKFDIVLTTRGTVGNFAFYSEQITYKNIRINSGMVILRKKGSNINFQYLYYYCKSEFISNLIKQISFGNAQLQLTVAQIKKIKLHFPKKQEQQKIADCLTSLDELIDAQSQKLLSLKQHKKGLMQKLFPEN